MGIPKIIHQVWLQGKDKVPEKFRTFRQSWLANHTQWTHMLWDDESIQELLLGRFPWFIKTYRNYKHMIQRVDSARYFILYEYGGFSIDVDMKSTRPLDILLDQYSSAQMIISRLPFTASEGWFLKPFFGTDILYTNAVIGTSKHYYVWESILSSLAKYQKKFSMLKLLNVICSTGPAFFSLGIEEYLQEDPKIIALHERFFESGFSFDKNRDFSEDAFAEHHQEASWHPGFFKFLFNQYFVVKNLLKRK
jgi:inositol phosphorylceramide mannosyltransferase catalytic subunit